MSRKKQFALAAVVCSGLAVMPATAQASNLSSVASVGEVNVVVNGQTTTAEPLAPCSSPGTGSNSTSGQTVGTTIKYGYGKTTCAMTPSGESTGEASGQRFETSILKQFGGPTIKLRTFNAKCETNGNGSSGYIQLGGLTGVSVPSDIPGNYTVTVPGKNAGDPPIAHVIFNELVAPEPPNGSLTTHTMHIKLFPQGGPASGDIIVGTASCDPFAA